MQRTSIFMLDLEEKNIKNMIFERNKQENAIQLYDYNYIASDSNTSFQIEKPTLIRHRLLPHTAPPG
jgi:hypothetical protein